MSRSSGLAKLTAAAAKRRDARSRKTRIAVQIGHCSQAVGAIPVAEAIRSSLDGDSYVVDTGCDGGCFDAPQVLVTDSSGETRRYGRLSPEPALRIVEGDADQRIDSGFYSNQCRITLDGCGEMDVANVDDYILRGGYKGLEQALSMSPDDVIDDFARGPQSDFRSLVLAVRAIGAAAKGTSAARLQGDKWPLGNGRKIAVLLYGEVGKRRCGQGLHVGKRGDRHVSLELVEVRELVREKGFRLALEDEVAAVK